MLKIIFGQIFVIIFLPLHQNKCQNIGTPPLTYYRVTPTLKEADPYVTQCTVRKKEAFIFQIGLPAKASL